MSKPNKPSRILSVASKTLGILRLVLFLVALTGVFLYTRAGTPTHVSAAVPNTLNFQARLLTGSGSIVPDGTYNAEFKLYNALTSSGSSQGSCTGDAACVWTETRLTTDAANLRVNVRAGYLSVSLGDKTAFTGFSWDQQLYLAMNIGTTAVTPVWDGEMTPRLKLTSVPYAQAAARANQLAVSSGANTGTLSFNTLANNPVIQLPDVAGTNNVLLQSGTTLFTQGSIPFTDSTGRLTQDNANFFFDDTNNTLGIGTTRTGAIDGSGNARLIVKGSGTTNATSSLNVTNSSNASLFYVRDDGNVGVGDTSPNALLTVGNGDMFQVDASGNTSLDNQADLRLYEADGNGSNYIGLQAPSAIGSDVTLTWNALAQCTGTNGGALTINGSSEVVCTDDDGGGGGGTLQQSYDVDVDGSDSIIALTTADDSVIFRNPASSGTDSAFLFQLDNLATGSTIANFKNLNLTSAGSFDTTASAVSNYGGYFSNTSIRSAGTNDLTNIGLYATASGAQFNYAAIFENGNVGIGTINPTAILHVSAAGGGTDLFKVTDTTATAQDVLRVADGGAVTLRNQTNSTAAFQVQSAASGTDVLTVDTTNSQTILRGINSAAVIGSDIVTSNAFNNATFWACSSGWTPTGTNATHNTGSTTACTATNSNFTVTAGATYEVTFTIAGNTTASNYAYPNIGSGNQAVSASGANTTHTYVITATNTNQLSFSPMTGFDGTISNVQVRLVTLSTPVLQVKNVSNTVALEVRASSDTSNTFVGLQAGQANVGGDYNTAFGSNALQSTTNGSGNTAIGSNSLRTNTSGGRNTALGVEALQANSTGSDNTAVGYLSLYSNSTGTDNVAIGRETLVDNRTGSSNTAVGIYALYSNTIGTFNTALGRGALEGTSSGSNNIGIGYHAGYTSNGANRNTTGSNNTFIGYNSGPGTTTQLQNATAIGTYAVVNASDSIVLGCIAGTNGCTTSPNVGIGTTTFGTSGTSVLALGQATAPSTSPVDNVQLYVTDAGAGDARLRVRMEGGGIVTFPNETGTICTTGSVCTGYAAAPVSGNYLQQVPTSNTPGAAGANIVAPTANSIVGLTVNGTTGTAATALAVVQGGNATAVSISGAGTGTKLSVADTTSTTGSIVSVTASNASQTTSTLLNVVQSGTTTGYTGNVVNFTGSSTTGASNLLNLTSVNTTAGNALNVTANALTTGDAVNINSTSAGLTTGSLLRISSATTGAVDTDGIVSLNATGNYTSTANAGLLNVLANATTAGTLAKFSGTALTTGQLLNLTSGTALTTGSALTLTGASYLHTGAETGSLASFSVTDASTATSGATVTNGLNISLIDNAANSTAGSNTMNGINLNSTINTTGATATKAINVINIATPTKTACTGGGCTWTGINVANPGTLANTTFYAATFQGGNVGIGNSAPAALFSVGTASAFQVNASGNIVTTGTASIGAANALTLGTASTNTGSITFQGSGGAGTLALNGPTTPNASNFTLSLPAITGNATVCTTNAICSGYASNLQTAYDNSGATNPQIQLSSANGGLKLRDGSPAVTGNLLSIQNFGGTATYLGISATAFTLQDSSANNALVFDSTTSELRVYDNVASPTAYARIYYSGGEAVFAASAGNTRIGSGNGDIVMSTTAAADDLSYTHSATLSGVYAGNDATISRTFTGGANAAGGAVLRVTDTSTANGGVAISPTLLLVNQAATGGTVSGNLIDAQTAGVSRFIVMTGGNVGIGASTSTADLGFGGQSNRTIKMETQAASNTAGNSFTLQGSGGNGTGAGGSLTVVAGAGGATNANGGNLLLQAGAGGGSGTTGSVIVQANAANSVTAFDVQNSSSNTIFGVDTTNSQAVLGKASTITGKLMVYNATNANTITIQSGVTSTGYTLTLPTALPGSTQCLQSTNTGVLSFATCGGGGGGGGRVTLSPEYPGGVLTPDGTNNVGTMTSDFCSGTSRKSINTTVCASTDEHTYYSWTSASGDNDYDIWISYQATAAFTGSTTVNVMGWRTDATNNDVKVQIFNAAGNECGTTSGTSVATGTGTWTETAIGGISGDSDCTAIAANDVIFIKIKLTATASEFARVGKIRIDY